MHKTRMIEIPRLLVALRTELIFQCGAKQNKCARANVTKILFPDWLLVSRRPPFIYLYFLLFKICKIIPCSWMLSKLSCTIWDFFSFTVFFSSAVFPSATCTDIHQARYPGEGCCQKGKHSSHIVAIFYSLFVYLPEELNEKGRGGREKASSFSLLV